MPVAEGLPFVPMLLPPDTPAISGTRWFWVRRDEVAISDQAPADGWPQHFIGMLGTVACWGVDVPDDADGPADAPLLELRRLWAEVPLTEWTAAGRAVQLVAWGRTHRYCGRCGHETEAVPGDRSMRCTGCSGLSPPARRRQSAPRW